MSARMSSYVRRSRTHRPLFFLPLGFSFFSLSILPLVQTLHFLIVIGLRLLVQEFLLLLGAFRSLEPLALRRLSPLR